MRLDPHRTEALFNRALALRKLGLHADAVAAWRDYLREDASSGWASDARTYIAALGRDQPSWPQQTRALESLGLPQPVLRDSQRARTYVEDELLSAWGRALPDGDRNAADDALRRAQAIATLLTRVTGDGMAEDEVACAYQQDDAALLARGHVDYANAIKSFRTQPGDAARLAFLQAARELDRAHSPLAFRARMYAATAWHYSGHSSEVTAEVNDMIRQLGAKAARYPSLTGQLEWVAGLSTFTVGDSEGALAHYRAARTAFETTHDFANLAGVATVTAECLSFLGYDDEVWKEMLQAADLTAYYAPAQRRYLVLSEASRLAIARKDYGIARHFGELAQTAARATADATIECDALLMRADVDRLIGDPKDAAAAATAAERLVPKVLSSGNRNRIRCRIAIAKGASLIGTNPTGALSQLSEAEGFAAGAELAAYYPDIHQLKSDAYRALHRDDDAEGELHRGFEIYRRLAPTTNAVDRAMFARVGRQIADRMIAYGVVHDEPSAWQTAMAIRDYSTNAPAADASQALIAYHVLDDELLVWVVRGGQRRLVRRPISSADLRVAVEGLVRAAREAESMTTLRPPAERVFDILIRPIAPHIRGATQLSFMTDSMIDDVPFAILRNRDTGRMLLEDVETAIVEPPSDHAAARPPAQLDRASLFIAVAPDVRLLPSLPGARQEGQTIAASWRRSAVCAGSALTPQTFLDGALSHEVVHYAGHITQPLDPARASLRLTPARGDGRVTASDLEKLAAHPPQLVVLSACASAAGRHTAQGRLSVARALFRAGVPTVVASLWDVDDGATTPLMADFYAALANGTPPGAALRTAQRQAITRSTPPRNWVVFQTYVSQWEL